jgi:hypothetical protein
MLRVLPTAFIRLNHLIYHYIKQVSPSSCYYLFILFSNSHAVIEKVFALEQAMKAQTGSRGIALLFL